MIALDREKSVLFLSNAFVMKRILVPIFIVVEPFHFAPAAPAPAPAPALHCTGTLQFVAKKNLKNFTSKITGPCFIHSKVRVLCFHLKGQINLLHEIVVMFVAYTVGFVAVSVGGGAFLFVYRLCIYCLL